MIARAIFCVLGICIPGFSAAARAAEDYTWWVDPCTPQTAQATACQPGDEELGRWALEAWQREANGVIVLRKSRTQMEARIRIHWANGASSLYGETRAI